MTEKNQFNQSSEGSNKSDGTKTGAPETISEKPLGREEFIDMTEFVAEESEPDEEIIDLLEETRPDSGVEDDIIDLDEIAAEESEPDEGIIDLLEETRPDSGVKDDIIDLDEIAAGKPEPEDDFAGFFEGKGAGADSELGIEDGIIDLTDTMVDETEEDDDIIDLLDETLTGPDIGEVTGDFNGRDMVPDARVAQKSSSSDSDFVDSLGLDLSSVSEGNTAPPDTDLRNGEAIEELGLDPEDTSLQSGISDTDAAQDDIYKTQTEKETPSDLSGIPTDQLEKILKRIVDEMFSEKIEQMLATFIEKAVAREIERLKEILIEKPSDT
ncbi:MAG: hypothetical protein JRE58_01195 [Deltaproteobacteria bacterium]|nr:hypothetical protein [Deltaproteobacteria bacterium]